MLLLEGVSNFYRLKLLFLDQLENLATVNFALGSRQSPIPIDDGNVIRKTLPPLEFHNYDKLFTPVVNNTGSLVCISSKRGAGNEDIDSRPFIRGGPLEADYVLANVHFHWDSEHTINEKIYPLEAHFVHYRKDSNTFEEAQRSQNGLCVLSVLYEISRCGNPHFDEISEAVEEICDEVGNSVECEKEISYQHLLPKYKNCFYTYEGSLTTPNSAENVIWIIFGEQAKIGRAQLKSLTSITDQTFEPVFKNSRELQNVNGREIVYTSSFLSRVRRTVKSWQQSLFGTQC